MSDLDRSLQAVLWALRDYLPDLVLIGGWVPELYRRYGGFPAWASKLSGTSEADVLVPASIPRGARTSIPDALRAAGFEPHDPKMMAPVWTRNIEKGERVEFLIPFATPVMRRGHPVLIENQPGLGALALPTDLGLLLRHTEFVRAPIGFDEKPTRYADVRVPTLGAYVVNKAVTFQDRPPDVGGKASKRSKDLLYLRDIAAAGEVVLSRVETDVDQIVRSDRSAQHQIQLAKARLSAALTGDFLEVAEMLSVREGLSLRAAESDIRGYLTDLFELLSRRFAR